MNVSEAQVHNATNSSDNSASTQQIDEEINEAIYKANSFIIYHLYASMMHFYGSVFVVT